MKDVKLIIEGIDKSYDSVMVKMNKLPKLGEYIKSAYFESMYDEIAYTETFKVVRILHYYNDVMLELDYTEIKLERIV